MKTWKRKFGTIRRDYGNGVLGVVKPCREVHNTGKVTMNTAELFESSVRHASGHWERVTNGVSLGEAKGKVMLRASELARYAEVLENWNTVLCRKRKAAGGRR